MGVDETPALDELRAAILEVGEKHSFLDLDHIIALAIHQVYAGKCDVKYISEFFERETPWETCVENLTSLGLLDAQPA